MANFPLSSKSRPERRNRSRKDLLIQSLTLFGVITAVIIVAASILITLAQPSTLSRTNRFNVSYWWDHRLLRYFFYLMVAGIVVSTIGLAINMKRLKRKYDSVRMNLVFLWLVSFTGILIYLLTI